MMMMMMMMMMTEYSVINSAVFMKLSLPHRLPPGNCNILLIKAGLLGWHCAQANFCAQGTKKVPKTFTSRFNRMPLCKAMRISFHQCGEAYGSNRLAWLHVASIAVSVNTVGCYDLRLGWGCSSAGKTLVRHTADTGSVPW